MDCSTRHGHYHRKWEEERATETLMVKLDWFTQLKKASLLLAGFNQTIMEFRCQLRGTVQPINVATLLTGGYLFEYIYYQFSYFAVLSWLLPPQSSLPQWNLHDFGNKKTGRKQRHDGMRGKWFFTWDSHNLNGSKQLNWIPTQCIFLTRLQKNSRVWCSTTWK